MSTTGHCQGHHPPPRGAGPDERSAADPRLGGPGRPSGSEDLGPQQEQSLLQGCGPVPSGTPGDRCHRRAAWALPGLLHVLSPGGTACSRLLSPQQTSLGHRPPGPWPWDQGGQPSPPLGYSGGLGREPCPEELGTASSGAAAAPTPPASRRNSLPAGQAWAMGFQGSQGPGAFPEG